MIADENDRSVTDFNLSLLTGLNLRLQSCMNYNFNLRITQHPNIYNIFPVKMTIIIVLAIVTQQEYIKIGMGT